MKTAVFFDFDSTAITKESLDEVIAFALARNPRATELREQIEEITNRGMEGALAFTESVKQRLAIAPLSKRDFETVGEYLVRHITPGMHEVMTMLDTHYSSIFIISGGFRETILPATRHLGIPDTHILSNTARFDDAGTLVGVDETSPLWTDAGKTDAIRTTRSQHGIEHATLVGDGANDLAAYTAGAVETFIGFGANVIRETVRTKAPLWAPDVTTLASLLNSTHSEA